MVNRHGPAEGPGQCASLDGRLRAGRVADVGTAPGEQRARVGDDALAAHGEAPQRRLGRAAPAGHAASLRDVSCRRYEAGSSAVSSAGAGTSASAGSSAARASGSEASGAGSSASAPSPATS